MGGVALPFLHCNGVDSVLLGCRLSSGAGSTADWLPVANIFMPKILQTQRDQKRIERLEQKKIILESKVRILQEGIRLINYEL